jgi:hypothetical protein
MCWSGMSKLCSENARIEGEGSRPVPLCSTAKMLVFSFKVRELDFMVSQGPLTWTF